jgi:hypothetical protein
VSPQYRALRKKNGRRNSGHFNFNIGYSVSRLARNHLAECSLRSREARDRHAVG